MDVNQRLEICHAMAVILYHEWEIEPPYLESLSQSIYHDIKIIYAELMPDSGGVITLPDPVIQSNTLKEHIRVLAVCIGSVISTKNDPYAPSGALASFLVAIRELGKKVVNTIYGMMIENKGVNE